MHCTLSVFKDLSKAFDTVDHSTLLKNLETYGIRNSNLSWFHSYLKQKNQYIRVTHGLKTDSETIVCGVPQGSILGSLLFLPYINNFPNCSDQLDPIMFADDNNLFFEHRNIQTLLSTVNE